ncbi:MAG: class I SAM-dependent methyltransferase [Candidatus Heimdallarchaeota archaeon]|nr:class I SAM-dependent methyltransferase [Candidatus Heimdallarchaeota archaeon]MBY8995777.1 class I SAM-dependent methyltransferase [Candidatus Heimdallarchaeota archaeon]
MSSHYYSEKPISTGKTTIIQTHQLGNRLSFKSQSGIFGWRKVDKGSELLLNNALIPKSGLILDLGCGYGFIGIALAKVYPEVKFVLTDINELAVKLAKENCKINDVSKNTKVTQGHLYEPVKDLKFDSIIANPPLMAGKKILTELVVTSKEQLQEKGSLQIVVPKKKGLKSMQKLMTEVYGTYEVLAKGSGFWVLKSEK